MKAKIIQALKTKYKNLGFSDKAFDGVAAYLEPSIKEETDIETAIAGVEGLLKAFQSEADSIRGGKTAAEKKLAELEAKVKELGGTPAQTEPEKKVDDNTPDYVKTMLESLKTISDKVAKLESEKVSTNRKQALGTILEKLPENLRKAYERTPVDSITDEQFEALKTEISAEVEGLVKESNVKGAVYGRPAADNGGNKGNELTKEQAAAVAQREAAPAGGQPF